MSPRSIFSSFLLAIVLTQTSSSRASEPRSPLVHVTLESPHDARLEVTDGTTWSPVCDRPCDLEVPAHETYRVVGPGMKPSAPFVLRDTGAIVLTVDPARTRHGALFGLVFGPIITLVGGALMYAAATTRNEGVSSYEDPRPELVAWGLIATIGGLAWTGQGVRDLASPGPKYTAVAMRDPRLPVPPPAPPPRRPKPDPTRRPDWYGQRRELVPAPATATLVKVRF